MYILNVVLYVQIMFIFGSLCTYILNVVLYVQIMFIFGSLMYVHIECSVVASYMHDKLNFSPIVSLSAAASVCADLQTIGLLFELKGKDVFDFLTFIA